MKKLIFTMFGILILMGSTTIYNDVAQAAPPDDIKVSLAMDKSIYVPGDTMNIIMTLENKGGDVITTKGFSDRQFYLLLRFYDDSGKIITSDKLNDKNSITPEAPRLFPDANGVLVQSDFVEILTSGWVVSFGPLKAYDFYPIADKLGHFTVKAIIPMRTYPAFSENNTGIKYAPLDPVSWRGVLESNILSFSLVADNDGDGYYYPEAYGTHPEADCDDNNIAVYPGAEEILSNGIDDDCNPATPDSAIVEPGTIIIQADKHSVGLGSHPGATKEPMAALPVRVYDKSAGSCASGIGVSWQHYKSIWLGCNYPDAAGITNSSGTLNLDLPPKDYIIIGEYNPGTGPKIYIGVSAGGLDPGETLQKYLQVIEKADGKKVPAKYTRKEGSELLVIEPEYIDWDGTQELYPFVFDSIGDWSVTTTVSPPEGFVADNDTLYEEVTSEVEAVQFTITDVGSRWVSTKVRHQVKHQKNKDIIIDSYVGIKLTPELAKIKGVGIYGEDDQGEDDDDQGDDKDKI